MVEPVRLETTRLTLRPWRDSDREPFAAMNADPEVMEHFPAPLTRAESDALVERILARFAGWGWDLWAVEIKAENEFAGFVGLHPVALDFPVRAAGPEVGWRLARRFWGQGLATEAARAALAFGFRELGFPEIVSYTAATNLRSRAVMERLGMVRDPRDDFDHPRLPAGHRLRRHVVFRLGSAQWVAGSL